MTTSGPLPSRQRLLELMPVVCEVPWESMTPVDGEPSRRLCTQCSKSVVRITDEAGLLRAMANGGCITTPHPIPLTGAAPPPTWDASGRLVPPPVTTRARLGVGMALVLLVALAVVTLFALVALLRALA